MLDTSTVVAARGLSKWFGETTALDRVDLRVDRGHVHGLVGANGAGKTTLLSIVFGLVLPDEGEIRLFGQSRETAGLHWLDGVSGFVESPKFYPYLSGRRNLRALAALDDGDAIRLVDDALTLVGLDGAAGQKVKGYSLGMRQRLGIAAAMLRRPRLLILDEPTNGMDPAGMRDLRSAIRRLADDGLTVLLSTHDLPQVEELCDTVTILDRGTVVAADTVAGLNAIAPDPVWRLVTSDDRAALRVAITVPDVSVDPILRGGLRVGATQAALDSYVLALGASAIAVRRLEQATSPLEALMQRLTPSDPSAAAADAGMAPLGSSAGVS